MCRVGGSNLTGLALAVDGGKGHERAAQDHQVRKGQREPLPVNAEHAGDSAYVVLS